jgi:hypothetical protein
MAVIQKAMENQLKNIQTRTGKTLEELYSIYKSSGLVKHGEIRAMFIKEFNMGYGDAVMLASYLLKSNGDVSGKVEVEDPDQAVSQIYTGAKALLRPIHDEIMRRINGFGEFEILPKKGYLSLRRKRQFAMVGPATNSRIEVGLNMKNITPTNRLEQNPPGGMCQYKVKITSLSEVDDELVEWVKIAFNTSN